MNTILVHNIYPLEKEQENKLRSIIADTLQKNDPLLVLDTEFNMYDFLMKQESIDRSSIDQVQYLAYHEINKFITLLEYDNRIEPSSELETTIKELKMCRDLYICNSVYKKNVDFLNDCYKKTLSEVKTPETRKTVSKSLLDSPLKNKSSLNKFKSPLNKGFFKRLLF